LVVLDSRFKKESFDFPFNPNELNLTRNPAWSAAKVNSQDFNTMTYVSGGEDTLSFETWVDESEDIDRDTPEDGKAPNPFRMFVPQVAADWNEALGLYSDAAATGNTRSITTFLKRLDLLTTPRVWVEEYDEEGKESTQPAAWRKRPVLLQFIMGDLQFTGVLDKLTSQIFLFDETGNPKRAKIQIELKGRAFFHTEGTDPKKFFMAAGKDKATEDKTKQLLKAISSGGAD